MSSFTRSRTAWSGEQKKGISHNIPPAASHAGHVEQASLHPSHLAGPVRLPEELSAPLKFTRCTPGVSILVHWSAQLKAVKELVRYSKPFQRIWDAATPPTLRPVTGRIASVAITDLMAMYGLGGGRWVRQFTFGFDVVWGVSPRNSYSLIIQKWDRWSALIQFRRARPMDLSFVPRDQDSPIRTVSGMKPFCRAPTGGFRIPPLGESGRFLPATSGDTNVAFRFATLQIDKIRACGDFKYGRINLACPVRSPTTLPTWGHIGQLCLGVLESAMDWGSSRPITQWPIRIPLSPDQANACVVALRSPVGGRRYGFLPRALLVGASAAVLRYN